MGLSSWPIIVLLYCWSFYIYVQNHVCQNHEMKILYTVISYPVSQGRIYVAKQYPTFAKTMSMVGQKLTFLHQITLNVRQNLSVLLKNMQFLGKTYKFLNFSALWGVKTQHPTCRVVGIPNTPLRSALEPCHPLHIEQGAGNSTHVLEFDKTQKQSMLTCTVNVQELGVGAYQKIMATLYSAGAISHSSGTENLIQTHEQYNIPSNVISITYPVM